MWVTRQSDGLRLELLTEPLIGAGGEATIHAIAGQPQLAAKIWRDDAAGQHAARLAAMLQMPPPGKAGAEPGHVTVAWPTDALIATDGHPRAGRVVGFLMPCVRHAHSVLRFANPGVRRERAPLFSYRYLLRTARNLAAAIRSLHKAGVVVADVNESNILVTETALVTLVDTDSFQFTDAQGRVWPCPVARPDFTAPELLRLGDGADYTNRTVAHDLFGLAVVLFQLLMEGTHPFAGREIDRSTDPTPYDARIAAGNWPWASERSAVDTGRLITVEPMPTAPRFDALPEIVQGLFRRAFEHGHDNPAARPEAAEWQAALETAEEELATCRTNEQHRYSAHLGHHCPWCERRTLLGGRDPFPSRDDVRSDRHLSLEEKHRLGRDAESARPKLTPPAAAARRSPSLPATRRPTPPKPASDRGGCIVVLIVIVVSMLLKAIASANRNQRMPDLPKFPDYGSMDSGYEDEYRRRVREMEEQLRKQQQREAERRAALFHANAPSGRLSDDGDQNPDGPPPADRQIRDGIWVAPPPPLDRVRDLARRISERWLSQVPPIDEPEPECGPVAEPGPAPLDQLPDDGSRALLIAQPGGRILATSLNHVIRLVQLDDGTAAERQPLPQVVELPAKGCTVRDMVLLDDRCVALDSHGTLHTIPLAPGLPHAANADLYVTRHVPAVLSPTGLTLAVPTAQGINLVWPALQLSARVNSAPSLLYGFSDLGGWMWLRRHDRPHVVQLAPVRGAGGMALDAFAVRDTRITAVAVREHDRLVVSGDESGEVWLWQFNHLGDRGHRLYRICQMDGPVGNVVIAPDHGVPGTRLVGVRAIDGRARLFRVRGAQCRELGAAPTPDCSAIAICDGRPGTRPRWVCRTAGSLVVRVVGSDDRLGTSEIIRLDTD